jgi:hypothetical protein
MAPVGKNTMFGTKRTWDQHVGSSSALPTVDDFIQAANAGTGLQAFYATPLALKPTAAKPATEADVQDDDDSELDEVRRFAEIATVNTLESDVRMARLYKTFKAGWTKGNQIAAKKGRPRLSRGKVEDYRTAVSHALVIALRMGRRYIVAKDGSKTHRDVKVQSLKYTARMMIGGLAFEFPLLQRRQWATILHTEALKTIAVLQGKYKLSNQLRRKGCLWASDVAALIADCLENSTDGDVGCTFSVLLCMLLHSACRPSTLLPNARRAFFLQWEDIQLSPRRAPGRENSLGFDVFLRLRNFKGHGLNSTTNNAKVMNLQIRTVAEARNVLLDLGGLIVVLGLRLGIFGEGQTLDTLLKRDGTFGCSPEYRKTPVFCATRAKGYGLDEHTPLTSDVAASRFRNLLNKNRIYCEWHDDQS